MYQSRSKQLRLLQWGKALASLAVVPTFLCVNAQASAPSSGVLLPTSTSLTWQNSSLGTGALNGESSAVDGVNADTFTLNVGGTPAMWAGKVIRVRVDWSSSGEDYDVFVHKGTNADPVVASATNGIPNNLSTEEAVVIDPSQTGTGAYSIHVCYAFTEALLDQPVGTAEVIKTMSPRYLKGGLPFGTNTLEFPPGGLSTTEPSSRTDCQGNHYVSGIRGFPAGCDLWYYDLRPDSPTYDPNMRNPQYRGLPDGLTNRSDVEAGGDGGGDIDLAVSAHPVGPNNVPTLAFASLIVANISTGNSNNLAQSYNQNNAGNTPGGMAGDDRQWLEFYGDNVVYMLYRNAEPAVSQIQRSTDGGFSYGPARSAGLLGQVGGITVDQNDGTVYCSGSTGNVAVGIPDAVTGEPTVYNVYRAASDPNGVAHLFFVIKCGPDGTVYGCYSNDHNIYVVYSTNHGKTWSTPLRINDGPDTVTSVFPALAVGNTPGNIGVAWYGTSDANNDDNANWAVFYAEVKNATSLSPIIKQVQASDHFIHAGNISEGGLTGTANRNLGDYFQISFDTTGAAVIGYCDDHNDTYGNCHSVRQIGGESINGGRVPKPREGSQLPPKPAQLSPDGAQVVDSAHDVTDGAVGMVPTDSPLDILSIKYSNETTVTGDKVIVGSMKVSTLANITPGSAWKMNFAVNAPFATLNASGAYTNALMDRGDMFFIRATRQNDGTMLYEYGTVTRGTDGKMTSTVVGPADSGAIDPTSNTITVKLSASKLSPLVKHGGPVVAGTILTGLRGSTTASTSSGAVMSDTAPGGTQYTIQ
jgi:hypothetical protein